ncbi:tachykinin-like peptides receptor 86C [Ptychodera flava]|uniref:tachykinin-like peptides receptor 86C n=1 Tax=Ptychodera flava TaxID=63121 RepID=UPI00396A93A5
MNNTTEEELDFFRDAAYVYNTELVMGIVGTIGNTIVLVVILSTRKLRTLTNYLLMNLAVADLLTSFQLVTTRYPTKAFVLTVPDGAAGELYCRLYFSAVFFWVSIKASTFNLILVTFERYFAIVHPLSYSTYYTHRNVVIMVATSWSFSFLLEIIFVSFHHYSQGSCHLFVYPDSSIGIGLGVFNFFVSFFIPIVAMVWAYASIVQSLRKSAQEIQQRDRRDESGRAGTLLQARNKVIRMLFLVLLAYVICWTPDSIMFLISNVSNIVSYTADYFNCVVLLAFANSVLNPFIYVFKYKQFREGLIKKFCCCSHRLKNKVDDESMIATVSGAAHCQDKDDQ